MAIQWYNKRTSDNDSVHPIPKSQIYNLNTFFLVFLESLTGFERVFNWKKSDEEISNASAFLQTYALDHSTNAPLLGKAPWGLVLLVP